MEWIVICDKHEKDKVGDWLCSKEIDIMYDIKGIKMPIVADNQEEAIVFAKDYVVELLGLNAIGSKCSDDLLQVYYDYSDYEKNSPAVFYDHFFAKECKKS